MTIKEIRSKETKYSDHKLFQVTVGINTMALSVGTNMRWTIDTKDRDNQNK